MSSHQTNSPNASPATPDPIETLLIEREHLSHGMALLQRFMTCLPGRDERPHKTNPIQLLVRDLSVLTASAATAAALAEAAVSNSIAMPLLVPALYGALTAAGRLRKLTVGHMHEAAHGVGFAELTKAMSRRRRRALRFWLAETCSVVALTQSAAVYMKKHSRHHSLHWLGTIYEPDGADLAEQGFVRPLPEGSFWRLLVGKLSNPGWYLRANLRRVKMTLGQGKASRRLSAALMWAVIFGSASVMPTMAWVFGVGLPWLVLYPAASLLQVLTKHPYGDQYGARNLDEYAARTWDRLPWDPTPSNVSGLGVLVIWAKWLLRFTVLHLPARLTVLDTTMVWHRWHHLAWLLGRPFDEWWNIGYEARDAWKAGILPGDWQHNTLNGLPAALARQRQHMESHSSR